MSELITLRDAITVHDHRPTHNGIGAIVRARANADHAWRRYYAVVDQMEDDGVFEAHTLAEMLYSADQLDHEYRAVCAEYHQHPAPIYEMVRDERDPIDRQI